MGKHANCKENTYSRSITVSMLPVDMRALNELAKKRGCSRNQIMREALHEYYQLELKEKEEEKNDEINTNEH